MFRLHTPVEKYKVNGENILVKRDDLFSKYPAPHLAKLRGASVLLQKMKKAGVEKVGVFDTRISKAGQGISYVCKELGLECLVGFPKLANKDISESHKIAEQLGAELVPMKAGRTAVCYSQFRKLAKEQGATVLPLGLVCKETVEAVADETEFTTLVHPEVKTIVMSTGTGTIFTGIAVGTSGTDIAVIGVSCGMNIGKQWQRIRELAYPLSLNSNRVKLIPPSYDYYEAVDASCCPFQTSVYYDIKAWNWLLENISTLAKPVMFWNIGV